MRLKSYPEYKESGLSWVDKLPAGWDVLRAKCIFNQIDIRSEAGEEELLSVSEKQGVTPRKNVNVTMFKAESYKGYKLCWPGDLVINSLWAWMQGLGFSRYHGIISTAYGVYRIKKDLKTDYKYFDYLFRSAAYLWELRVRSKGIWRSRYQFTDDAFMTMPVIIPSESEQRQIVRFLDFKCARVAKFILNKRRLIQLLKEQKQIIINQAVTRGINPNVKMKPSGIDWLGDIPAHWKKMALRRCCSTVKTGTTPTGASEEYYSTGGFNWYTPGDFTEDLYFGKSGRQLSILGESQVRKFPSNTIMIIGIGGTIGKVAISKDVASCNQQINAIVVKRHVDVEFFAYYLRTLREFITKCGKFATLPIINQDETKDLPVLLPELKEQMSIVEQIKQKTRKIDETISRIEHEIELIRQYRMRLISDVVTGGVDVRNIKVEDIADDKLIEDVSDTEESEEIIDSVEEVPVED